MENRILTGKRGDLTTNLTNQQAVEICAAMGTGFGAELAGKAKVGTLSNEQWWWMHKIAMEQAGKKAKPSCHNVGNMAAIMALFARAGEHLKVPKIRLRTESGQGIRVLRAGSQSSKPGTLSVTSDGSYEDRLWYGRIELDGTLRRGKDMTDEIVALLTRFAADPQGVALEYGKLTGNCCFCGRQLEEEGSLEVGYGPICAGHYDLPHPQNGTMPSPQPEVVEVAKVPQLPGEPKPVADLTLEQRAQAMTVHGSPTIDAIQAKHELNRPAWQALRDQWPLKIGTTVRVTSEEYRTSHGYTGEGAARRLKWVCNKGEVGTVVKHDPNPYGGSVEIIISFGTLERLCTINTFFTNLEIIQAKKPTTRTLDSDAKREAFKIACEAYQRVAYGDSLGESAVADMKAAEAVLQANGLQGRAAEIREAAGLAEAEYHRFLAEEEMVGNFSNNLPPRRRLHIQHAPVSARKSNLQRSGWSV